MQREKKILGLFCLKVHLSRQEGGLFQCFHSCLFFPFILEPGEFLFQNATAHVQYRLRNVSMVTTTVVRIRGSDGPITVFYRTM